MDNSLEKFTITSKDEDIIETFEKWLTESATYHDEILVRQRDAFKYYIGNQTDMESVPAYLSNTVENRIFEGVETLVPVATSNAHQFSVAPGSEVPNSIARAQNLQKVLGKKYEQFNMQEKLEEITRDMLIKRYGVLKYGWSELDDDFFIEKIDPSLIYVPKLRGDVHELPYMMEVQGYTSDEIKQYFPKIKKPEEELTKYDKKVMNLEGKDDPNEKEFQVFEVWSDEMVAWISSGKVLDKKVNPYYDFKGQERKIFDDEKKKFRKETKFFNHLDKPTKPYVFFQLFNNADTPLPPTSLVEIVMPIQMRLMRRREALLIT